MNYSSFWIRLAAYLIDNVTGAFILGLLFFINLYLILVFGKKPGSIWWLVASIIISILVYLLFVLFNEVYLVVKKGGSIGKIILGLKIVDAKGKNISAGPAFLRLLIKGLLKLLTIMGMLAYAIPILCTEKHQSLGDMAASCFVVDK
jgi:uncharacterized RDD family membrane protein YckC